MIDKNSGFRIEVYTAKNWVQLLLAFVLCGNVLAQSPFLEVEIDTSKEFQTIRNFAASDAWAAQYTGLWPDAKRNQMVERLFSTALDSMGSPIGIGLSAWRFNIGAGSAEQGLDSGIKDPWRRAEGFLQKDGEYDWNKQKGQQWFLRAAKTHGVKQFIAFVNSPPIQLTRNGKAHSDDGLESNLPKENYGDYANFLADVVQHFGDSLKIDFDYISPFNEPQWEWKGGQEGSPWNNNELANATRVIDSVFLSRNMKTKIEITEAGAIDYLTGQKKKFPDRSDQIETFFDPSSPNYLGNLEMVAPKIAAHSYFTTWDVQKMKKERQRIKEKLEKYPALEYWMSEYCILENNEEIKGKGRDLGMQTALYVARLIHADLTIANASAWHWWLAMSTYDFKDGLIYVDKNTRDGNMYDSKLLWALGNYSRFIRPGAKRVSVNYPDSNEIATLKSGMLISCYINKVGSVVLVVLNQGKEAVQIRLNLPELGQRRIKGYETSKNHNLQLVMDVEFKGQELTIDPKSVTTLVMESF